jgi:hypothetical protein
LIYYENITIQELLLPYCSQKYSLFAGRGNSLNTFILAIRTPTGIYKKFALGVGIATSIRKLSFISENFDRFRLLDFAFREERLRKFTKK